MAMMAEKARLAALLPEGWSRDMTTFLSLSQEVLLSLLSFCTACSIHGVQTRECGHTSRSPLDTLESAIGFHMRDWWQPTKANFFGHLKRGGSKGDTVMKTELTLNVLQTMNAQEYEDIRAAGSDMRRNLTHEVMRKVDAPANWMMNGEYGSEFGGFFPVQVRFTPAHERFHLALCSPGDVSQLWMLVLVNGGGQPFAVVQVQHIFTPVAISHTLALAATLDAQGYSVNDIIHILMAEGGQA